MTQYWAPMIHLYQPPWQDVDILKTINKESYIPLLTMMERHPNAKITLNIQGCLLDMLAELGLKDTIKKINNLVQKGKIELVGSAKFHPILPLIPEKETIRQVKENECTLVKYFGENWKKSGFFPPEMAVTPETSISVGNLGYKWMIMSGIANTGLWPSNFIQESPTGLLCFFRDNYLSNDIAFEQVDAQGFIDKVGNLYGNKNSHYVITAMDGETFGHHIKYYETSFLGKAFSLLEDTPEIQVVTISELLGIFSVKTGPAIQSSSWSTDQGDLEKFIPYPLWKHPLNPIHKHQYRMLKALYRLMDLVEVEAEKNGKNPSFQRYYQTSRWFYDRALHSCWLWWGSMRPHWSPNLIYKGIDLIMKTSLNAQLALVNLKIGEGDEFYSIIVDNLEKLMMEMMNQEVQGQQVRTF